MFRTVDVPQFGYIETIVKDTRLQNCVSNFFAFIDLLNSVFFFQYARTRMPGRQHCQLVPSFARRCCVPVSVSSPC